MTKRLELLFVRKLPVEWLRTVPRVVLQLKKEEEEEAFAAAAAAAAAAVLQFSVVDVRSNYGHC